MPEVQLSRNAARDLRALPPNVRDRVARALRALAAGRSGLDIKAIVGARPWRRLRVGDHRVLFRRDGDGLLVARIIDRKELLRASVRWAIDVTRSPRVAGALPHP